MKEIIAAMIGTVITNNYRQIAVAIETNMPIEFIERARIDFMVACDSGIQWEKLAKSKTIFCVSDNGEILPPN